MTCPRRNHLLALPLLAGGSLYLIAAFCGLLTAEVGDEDEPIRYVGPDGVSESSYKNGTHDGRLRPAVGTQNTQILRANRSHPEWSDRLGWTYNHAPNLAYWKGKFYCHYLATPVGEHIPPGVTLLTVSADGKRWPAPRVLFPMGFWAAENTVREEVVHNLAMHQRMGFYIAPNGRFLTFGFYGINDGHGMGRVVREVRNDGSFGPVYCVRPNDNWTKGSMFPLYTESSDGGFVSACNAFLSDRIRRVQWWEEDWLAKDARSFYGVPRLPDKDGPRPGKAFCFYTRPDGVVVGLFKDRWATLTGDGGRSWSKPARIPTLTYGGAKVWAQRTDDGAYAAVYNPTGTAARHPLAVATSADGVRFDNLAAIHGEVPPKRFWGLHKRPGPQYVRGIVEGNGNPPGNDLWVVYSVNKEDIWISRVPVPIRRTVTGPIADNFDRMEPGGVVTDWNVYCGRWIPVEVVVGPGDTHHSLKLEDRDPYDYARAVRVFGRAPRQRLQFSLYAESLTQPLDIDVTSGHGERLVQLRVASRLPVGARLTCRRQSEPLSTPLKLRVWHRIEISLNAAAGHFQLLVDGETLASNAAFSVSGGDPERIVFRTGDYRLDEDVQKQKSGSDNVPGWDEPGADEPVDAAIYYLRDFQTEFQP